MSALTLVTIALITYASRAAAVVLLPRPSARFETVLSRIPVAIFASLATATLLGAGGGGGPAGEPGAIAAAGPDRRGDRLRGGALLLTARGAG